MSCPARVGVYVGGQNKQPGQTQSVTLVFFMHKMAFVIAISLLCLANLTLHHQLPICCKYCCTPPMQVVMATTVDDGMGCSKRGKVGFLPLCQFILQHFHRKPLKPGLSRSDISAL